MRKAVRGVGNWFSNMRAEGNTVTWRVDGVDPDARWNWPGVPVLVTVRATDETMFHGDVDGYLGRRVVAVPGSDDAIVLLAMPETLPDGTSYRSGHEAHPNVVRARPDGSVVWRIGPSGHAPPKQPNWDRYESVSATSDGELWAMHTVLADTFIDWDTGTVLHWQISSMK